MARNPLKGSERRPLPGAKAVGMADPAERLEVSVLLRRHNVDSLKDRVSKLTSRDRTGGLRTAGVNYYADHDRSGKGEINHYYGGRGVYFDTPDGNLFEIITQPYGAVPESLGGRDAAQTR